MATIDVGNLSSAEVKELAAECMGYLSLNERIQAVLKAFDSEEREELARWIEQPEDEDAEEEPSDEEDEEEEE
jgi:hypothetical protein